MRLVVPALLLLLAAAAPATAQQGVESGVTVEVGELPEPVMPLSGVATTDVIVTVACALLADGAATPKRVALEVAEAPTWTRAIISPAELPASPQECDGTTWRGNATLIVTTTAEAPAFSPEAVRVSATVPTPTGPTSGSGTASVEADFFSILDITTPSTTAQVAPGERATFTVGLTNLGNAPTKVRVAADGSPAGWEVVKPQAFTLESLQTGGTRVALEFAVHVEAPAARGFVNQVEGLVLRVTSAYAMDAILVGDDGSLSFLVNVKGFEAAAPPLLPALAVAAGLLARYASNRGGGRA